MLPSNIQHIPKTLVLFLLISIVNPEASLISHAHLPATVSIEDLTTETYIMKDAKHNHEIKNG